MTGMKITITPDELRALIREEVRAELDERGGVPMMPEPHPGVSPDEFYRRIGASRERDFLMMDTIEAMRLGVDEFKRREALGRTGSSDAESV